MDIAGTNIRTLWWITAVWLVVTAVLAYATYPLVTGSFTASLANNPLWTVAATGVPEARLVTITPTGGLLAMVLWPIGGMCLLSLRSRITQRNRTVDVRSP